MAGGVPGGMGQAICPGARPALMALVVLTLLTLPWLKRTLPAGTRRGSGGAGSGRDVLTAPATIASVGS